MREILRRPALEDTCARLPDNLAVIPFLPWAVENRTERGRRISFCSGRSNNRPQRECGGARVPRYGLRSRGLACASHGGRVTLRIFSERAPPSPPSRSEVEGRASQLADWLLLQSLAKVSPCPAARRRGFCLVTKPRTAPEKKSG